MHFRLLFKFAQEDVDAQKIQILDTWAFYCHETNSGPNEPIRGICLSFF